jgi:endonuclease/exonuclease/phosphatase family metal-dependent hydrolase
MVQYSDSKLGILSWEDDVTEERAVDRLIALRAGLRKEVSIANKQTSFHLATWNIRDFGGHGFNPSPRMPESLMYIAEIISAFDLVAVQEVNEDMREFEKLMQLLGPYWSYLVTDQSGNKERLAFVYDTRKILFRNLAGEIVLPGTKRKPVPQFSRTPYLVAFQAGWFKFNLCTVHIYYGSASDTEQRIAEISNLAKFFTERQKKDGATYILLGDFNILKAGDPTMDALVKGGFSVPPELHDSTALASVNHYDQIALRESKKQTEIAKAGVFQWQDYVFRGVDDYAAYKPFMKSKTGKAIKTDLSAYQKWRTWQISDHKPLWAEIKVDFTEDYLNSLRPGEKPLANFPDTSTEPRHQ